MASLTRVSQAFNTVLSHRVGRWLLLAASIAAYLAHARAYWSLTPDSTFVTLRYARNLADGLGFVLNPDEPVEGLGSVLWTWWVSVGIGHGAQPLLFAKISSAVFGLGALFLLGWRVHALAAILLAASGMFARWSVSGTEVPLCAAALSAGLVALQERKLPFAAMFLGLLPWIRPEAALLTVVLLAPALIMGRSLGPALVALVPLAALACWRHEVFGQWMPGEIQSRLLFPNNWGYLAHLRETNLPALKAFWLANPTLLALWIGTIAWAFLRREPRFATPHVAALLTMAGFVAFSGDSFPSDAWCLALLPLLLVASGGLMSAMSRTLRSPGWRPAIVLAYLAVLVGGAGYESFAGYFASGRYRLEAKNGLFLYRLGQYLASGPAYEDNLLAGDFARIGYASSLRIVDPSGLFDTQLRRIGATPVWRADGGFALAQNPEWMLIRYDTKGLDQGTSSELSKALAAQPAENLFTPDLWRKIAPHGRWRFERDLMASAEFHARFRTLMVTPELDGTFQLALFCRQDTCEREAANTLRWLAPNLGRVKAEQNRGDAEQYLSRTLLLLPGEENAQIALAARTRDRKRLRSIASDWTEPPATRGAAYTALGLDEYSLEQYGPAYQDFQSALETGDRQPNHYSNIGWALEAMGKKEEAKSWLKKGGIAR